MIRRDLADHKKHPMCGGPIHRVLQCVAERGGVSLKEYIIQNDERNRHADHEQK